MNDKKMTAREFYTTMMEKYDLTDELNTYCVEALASLDRRNDTRKSKATEKSATENAPIRAGIIEALSADGCDGLTETELGEALEITHNKAGAIARGLVKDGLISVEERKFPKVGKRKVYFVEK